MQEYLRNNLPVDVTQTKKKEELCESAKVLHVHEFLEVCLCYTEHVICAGLAKTFYFGRKSMAFFQLRRYASRMDCQWHILNFFKILVVVFTEDKDIL